MLTRICMFEKHNNNKHGVKLYYEHFTAPRSFQRLSGDAIGRNFRLCKHLGQCLWFPGDGIFSYNVVGASFGLVLNELLCVCEKGGGGDCEWVCGCARCLFMKLSRMGVVCAVKMGTNTHSFSHTHTRTNKKEQEQEGEEERTSKCGEVMAAAK
jgi:hypothetical protein